MGHNGTSLLRKSSLKKKKKEDVGNWGSNDTGQRRREGGIRKPLSENHLLRQKEGCLKVSTKSVRTTKYNHLLACNRQFNAACAEV